jgi:hypothetical protein
MRLVTRADFDGIVCGSLVTLMEEIDSYLFVEPKFMQDGMVEIRPGDIIANLPYHPNCALWFDHHITNEPSWLAHIGIQDRSSILDPPSSTALGKGGFRIAPSAARVVYEYYTQLETRNPKLEILRSERMRYLLEETDRIDAGQLVPDDVLQPKGYVLISMTLDGKRPEDEPYWLRLIPLLRDRSLEDVLGDPEVRRRCQELLDAQERLKKILLERATVKGNVIYVDLRGLKEIPDGNRFLLYTLFPGGNISVKVADDSQRPDTTAISVGYNIFNATSKVNVGALMEKHGGGGHRVVGSCRVPNDQAEKAIREILQAVKE